MGINRATTVCDVSQMASARCSSLGNPLAVTSAKKAGKQLTCPEG